MHDNEQKQAYAWKPFHYYHKHNLPTLKLKMYSCNL